MSSVSSFILFFCLRYAFDRLVPQQPVGCDGETFQAVARLVQREMRKRNIHIK